MTKTEIIILCNSAPCLDEISSGRWPDLHTRNIFTCNLAYTYFRTSGMHLNVFSDCEPIKDFLLPGRWQTIYGTWKYDKIRFVFSKWDLDRNNVQVQFRPADCISPVAVGASSGINALFFLNSFEEKFDTIWLVGYTINEWESVDKFPNLKAKKEAFDEVYKNYTMERVRPFTYKFSLKNDR